jgi:4-amino-4-deoxy-L-arabinose transferase-like glycosyltransferase
MGIEETTLRSLPYECRAATRDSIILFLLGVFIFVLALPPEFIGLQARFAMFGQEMLRNGPSFFPTVYGRPYPDYPAGSVFLIYLASLPFGRVTPLSAVLPTAIVSALILVLTYGIGALRSRRWGLAAAMFAVATVEFIGDSRSTGLDQYTSLATALSFYLVYSADRLGRSGRLWLLPLAWLFGFAFRGPIGLVTPVAVTLGYCLWNARFRRLAIVGGGAIVVSALCIKGLLMAAEMQGGQTLVQKVLDAQVTGRISDRGEGFSYYWLRCLTSYALSYPVAVVVVACRFRDIVRRTAEDDRLLGSLAAWVLVVLVGMSIPSVKHTRYLLPIVPALSLIAAHLWVDPSPAGALLTIRRLFDRVCSSLLLPIALAVTALVLIGLTRELGYVAALGASILLIVIWKRRSSEPSEGGIRSLGLCAATFVIATLGIADPINYSLEKTGPFVRQVEALRESRPGGLMFFKIGPDQEDIKFVVNMSKPVEPQFISSVDELRRSGRGHYIIAEELAFQSLPPDVKPAACLLRGRIGHEDVVVFALEPPPRN